MRGFTGWLAAMAIGLSGLTLRADEPGATGPDPLAPVEQAYRDTRQYQATVTFEVQQDQGRITQIQRMDFYVLFDRDSQRLLLDKPDLRVLVGDGRLRLVSGQIAGHHLDMPLTAPMSDWNALTAVMPQAFHPALPDVTLLLAADPSAALSRAGAPIRAGDQPDTFIVTVEDGPMTLHVDPDTHLIDRAEIDVAGSNAHLTYRFEVDKHNEAIDESAFALDTRKSQSHASLTELRAALQQTQAGGQSGGAEPQAGSGDHDKHGDSQPSGGGGSGASGGGGHVLENNVAPALVTVTSTGEAFDLQQVGHRVVVLDFWATWCGPCRMGLPHVQAVSDWVKETGRDAAVYTVNVQETPDAASAMWRQMNLTMPILMDGDGAISQAYGVQGIPQTVVIADGRVVRVYVGFSPTLEQDLKKQIDAALATQSRDTEEKRAPPAP